jgi:ABC-type nitrate/sulfonate/bicarbonate transport system permease component
MQRYSLLQRACETWVAAFASAPLVLTYPLFMVIFGRNAWTIIMMGFLSALPPVILKTIEGISGTRKVLVNVGRSLQADANTAILENSVSRGVADHFRRHPTGTDLCANQCGRH